ncbi:hypothetical protein H4219_001233 [Mycoemilia scoparia]|uniref:Uncharacterized protein n=1 Tax=Mycoemilia scoparia TaxID=417184 RepID=A0A9W8DWA7_9FUNG|nr:hypothetical protein H4219_001233 [Mycoemilia scoparia]
MLCTTKLAFVTTALLVLVTTGLLFHESATAAPTQYSQDQSSGSSEPVVGSSADGASSTSELSLPSTKKSNALSTRMSWIVPESLGSNIVQLSSGVSIIPNEAPDLTEWVVDGWDSGYFGVQRLNRTTGRIIWATFNSNLENNKYTANSSIVSPGIQSAPLSDLSPLSPPPRTSLNNSSLFEDSAIVARESTSDKSKIGYAVYQDFEWSAIYPNFYMRITAHHNSQHNITEYQGFWSSGQIWVYLGAVYRRESTTPFLHPYFGLNTLDGADLRERRGGYWYTPMVNHALGEFGYIHNMLFQPNGFTNCDDWGVDQAAQDKFWMAFLRKPNCKITSSFG